MNRSFKVNFIVLLFLALFNCMAGTEQQMVNNAVLKQKINSKDDIIVAREIKNFLNANKKYKAFFTPQGITITKEFCDLEIKRQRALLSLIDYATKLNKKAINFLNLSMVTKKIKGRSDMMKLKRKLFIKNNKIIGLVKIIKDKDNKQHRVIQMLK